MRISKSEYEHIFNKYGDMLYRVVYCYCKNKADSEDVLQNTFLKLYLSDNDFDGEEHIKNWLFKIAVNNALNIRKSRWHSFKEIPEDYEMKNAEQSEVYESILKLPDKYRIVILLFYYVGYSIKEMSGILNRSESTIQTQLQRGREKLKGILKEKM